MTHDGSHGIGPAVAMRPARAFTLRSVTKLVSFLRHLDSISLAVIELLALSWHHLSSAGSKRELVRNLRQWGVKPSLTTDSPSVILVVMASSHS